MWKWLIGFGVILGLLFAAWCVFVIYNATYWQLTIGGQLQQELGFHHGTPYVTEDGSSWPREVLTVEGIVPGGAFDRAGFRRGDIIRGHSLNGLYQHLHSHRGQQVTIRAVDGGDGPPLGQRPERAITFFVPAAP